MAAAQLPPAAPRRGGPAPDVHPRGRRAAPAGGRTRPPGRTCSSSSTGWPTAWARGRRPRASPCCGSGRPPGGAPPRRWCACASPARASNGCWTASRRWPSGCPIGSRRRRPRPWPDGWRATARRGSPPKPPRAPRPGLPGLVGLRPGPAGIRAVRARWEAAARPAAGADRRRRAAAPVHLDLKESAQGGMGPHGLVIGATGSGKSELLRTLVLGLAATHSPEAAELGAGRLQGRRDLRRARRRCRTSRR